MDIQPAAPSLTLAQKQVVESGSWGAAIFTWVYLLAMRSPKDALILFLLQVIPIVNLVSWVYYILNGKKLAWANRTWQGFDDFLACQRIWDRWGKVCFAIIAGLTVLGILLAILLPLYLRGPRPVI